MHYLVQQIGERGIKPDNAVFGAMIYYIDAFPERFHHPKEDRYIFRFLRLRHPPSGPLLDRLEADHRAGAERMRTLEQAFARYAQGGDKEYGAFAAAVDNYVHCYREHMRLEETQVLPLAERYLTAEDWAEADAAFAGHSTPLFGAEQDLQFRELFRRIVNLAPPPIGLGSAVESQSPAPPARS
jgi:hemerythrin-like domain-containing protein